MKILIISIDLILGTRILINLLRAKGFEAQSLQIIKTKYLDILSAKHLSNIYEFCKEFDVIGLSFNSFNSLLAAQLGKYLKSKGKLIIAGGSHATALPSEVLEYSDIAVIYEAEITFPKLLQNLDNLSAVKGIVYKSNGRLINTGSPEIVTILDNIPFQALENITYYNYKSSLFEKPTRDNLFSHKGIYSILTSRGCPFRCTYCGNDLFAKINKVSTNVRKRSIHNIISEMHIAKNAGFLGFYIADDNFLAFTLEELSEFAEKYQSINLPFGVAGLNPNNMRAKDSCKKVDLLLGCGLSDVRIGIQSGSNKTLKIFNRGYQAEELPKLLTAFKDRNTIWDKPHDKLKVSVDFICDSPWENEQDKMDTLKLANNLLSTYAIQFYALIYLPGTNIYNLALKEGWLKNHENDIYLRGIAGVEDNLYNRLLFLIAVLKERGSKLSDEILKHLLETRSNALIDFVIQVVNKVESHHAFDTNHLIMHPYLMGFNEWTKTVGEKGKKVLFRSYHDPYG